MFTTYESRGSHRLGPRGTARDMSHLRHRKRERLEHLADDRHLMKRCAFLSRPPLPAGSLGKVAKELKPDWETVKTYVGDAVP